MYSVNREMPLQSYAIVNPCENQTNFQPGQIIRFTIPRATQFWDSRNSFVQFNVETTNANYKMVFNSATSGVASMLDMVRVSQNGKVVSEITEYALLQHFVKSYSNTLSTDQVDALEKGCVDYTDANTTKAYAGSHDVLLGQGLNRSGENGSVDMQRPTKFQLTLDFISLFEVLRVVPSILMGDILIEMRLADSPVKIMRVMPATAQTFTVPSVSTNDTSCTLTPPFIGFTNLADSPFIKGMKISFNVGPTERTITSLVQATKTGVITIGFAALPVGGNGSTTFTITSGSDGLADVNASTNFVCTQASLQLQVVKPPASYVQNQASVIEKSGMMLDVDNYTAYISPLVSNINAQTVVLNTTQSRAKSFFCIPRLQAVPEWKVDGSKDYIQNGQWSDLKSYRSQIDGQFYPNQPVLLEQFKGGWHFPQMHVRELEKAFKSSGLSFASIESLKQNFVVGRALSTYGSSTDLTGTPINVYLDYNGTGPGKSLSVVSFVHFTTRIMITPMGIEVMS